jgi:hypothetical protein
MSSLIIDGINGLIKSKANTMIFGDEQAENITKLTVKILN